MDNLKDTAKKIFEEIQITKSIKEGFDGCTAKQRYANTEKGRNVQKECNRRYLSSDVGKQKKKEQNRRYYLKRKLLNNSQL